MSDPGSVSSRRSKALTAAFAFTVAAALPPARAATIVVDTLADADADDSECSLREAIVAADGDLAYNGCAAGSGADTIELSVTGTIQLGSNLPAINKSVVLAGPPLDADGLPDLVVDGNNHRMIYFNGVPDGRTLTIQRLSLREGLSAVGGGCITFFDEDHLVLEDSRVISCQTDEAGGGIFGEGGASLTIRRSTIANNFGYTGGGAVYFLGDGWEKPTANPTATLLVEDSTVAGNEVDATSESPGGGFVSAYANGEIRRSTFSDNTAPDFGGGVLIIYGYVTIDQSTISDNTADSNDDDTEEVGAGLYVVGDEASSTTVVLHSTVIGGNFQFATPSDVGVGPSAAILSDGYNLIGVRDGAAAFFVVGAPNAVGDWVGSRSGPVLAGLSAIADNGGPTRTHAPSPGSLLVDHGECPGAPRDQRGYGDPATLSRPIDEPLVPDAADGCDIGAVEANASAVPQIFGDGFESAGTDAWSEIEP